MNDFNVRDLFAALAMTGMLANPIKDYSTNDDIVVGSYDLADVMLKEKEKRDGGKFEA